MQYAGLVESGTVNQRIHFLAPSGATLTVRQKRGTGSWTSKSTPAVSEDDQTNCPGAFSMLMNQDMTISANKIFEQLSFYVTDGAGWFDLINVVIVANNLPSNVKQVLGETLAVGGNAPLNPIGVV